MSLSNIDKLVEIEREAWISCPEMRTSVDTIRDRVLNNQAMNFAIFEMTGEDLEDTNDSLKGMMYTQFVKSTEDVSERNCWATKESARLKPFSSQTIQLLDVFADQRYSLENGGDVGMQLRDFVLHFAERAPMVETVCAVTRTRGFREVQQKAIKKIEEESERTQSSISEHLKASLAIPTYEQHACRKKADIMTVVYSCTWVQVQRSSRFSTVGDQKTTKTTAMGRSLNTKSKDFLGGDTQTSELLKLGVQTAHLNLWLKLLLLLQKIKQAAK